MQALSFLESVAGYLRAQGSSSDGRVKLGTIDPSYVSSTYPGTLPKITFDGESTLSGKTYPVIGSYLPAASDRVALIPVGTTYAIIGALDSDASIRVGGSITLDGDLVRDTWRAITPLNSWTNRGAGYANFACKKITANEVKIIGNLAPGTTTGGTTIGQLPAGYRPASIQSLTPAGATASATTATPTIQITTDGYLHAWYITTGGYVEINGTISLDAAQP
jgi:hypothetical protein